MPHSSYSYDRRTAGQLPWFLKRIKELEKDLAQAAKRYTGGKHSSAKIEVQGETLLAKVWLDMGPADDEWADSYQENAQEFAEALLGPRAVVKSHSVGPTLRMWVASAAVKLVAAT
jgi:hypothetical protein